MADGKGIIAVALVRVRQVVLWWRGGIERRVSFSMTVALVFVASLVAAFFFWKGTKVFDSEISNRALSVAIALSAFTAEDSTTGNRSEPHKKVFPSFTANEDSLSGNALLYLLIHNHKCEMPPGSKATAIFFHGSTHSYACLSAQG